MSDEQPPISEPDSDPADADALPPPSTWAGKARQGQEPGGSGGMTEEFEGLADELSADFEDLRTEEEELELAAADEEEEPPDEFAFEDVEGEESEPEPEPEEPDEADLSELEDEPDPTPPPGTPGVTVEADTLALSDVEAAREAAHAGLAKRAKKSSFSHEVTTGSHKVPAKPAPAAVAPAAPPPGSNGVGEPPKRRIGWRFIAAAAVIVSSMAAATAVSFLLFLSDIAEGLNDSELSAARAQLQDVEGGAPQTILILGSDQRETTQGDPGRSDTAILLRVDADKNFLSLMSLPRDLVVPIPGHGSDKLNAAYTYGQQQDPTGGGETLAIKTITQYLDIPINHVVNVDFGGFYEAVNAIGCVYIDVDRHYFHSNENTFEGSVDFYSEIDVDAGYQKLCGYKALQYVRYRHGDNDLVRGARQQDFIREARQRIPPRQLLPWIGEGDKLIDIFTKNTSSDINNVPTIIGMMKSFAAVREAPVRQVTLGELAEDGGVDASPEQVESAVNQFLGNDIGSDPDSEPQQPSSPPKPGDGGGDKQGGDKPPAPPPSQGLVDFAGPSAEKAKQFANFMKEKKADLPIYFPTKLVGSSLTAISEESRAAVLVGESEKELYYMYKFVLPYQDTFGRAYYGVSGTNWEDPPILKNPSDIRTIDGREYLLYYERDRLRLVGWQTSKGSYWVNNTLTHTLSEETMLGLATSARELDG